ncbi:lycopene cyclase domain-containing protein [Chitinophaga rhizophila]|uniref:Lycopene cyclase domain-containing protein n=1 Tax=Chitinophaga rhizophila TaxID=2866212 RepID=A0ABS7GL80_9BACT|nr:lycopene cyclase domain-containing protein [Chitinophaga rhizophila]MBW8687509.1 lycopene cyclase domain-containing protein [Chitinophaga rhizophila]
MHYTYLTIDLASVAVPFIASFHPKLKFYRQWAYLWPALLFPGLLFVCWDCFFTARGVWGFNPDYVTGLYLFNLPIEEILFFICIPYACLFSYHCLFTLWPRMKLSQGAINVITWLLLLIAVAGMIAFSDRIYTFVTLLLTAVFVCWSAVVLKKDWIGRFYICYGLMLLPFLVVNGLLTGSWIDNPVVWYNPMEIAGPRLMTIPLEDIAYGLLMIGVEVAMYEYLLGNSQEVKATSSLQTHT